MRRWFDANAWTLGLAVLLAALLLATKLIQPGFGVSGLDSLARAALPFALAKKIKYSLFSCFLELFVLLLETLQPLL